MIKSIGKATFEINLEVVATDGVGSCEGCFFRNLPGCDKVKCTVATREDRKNVIYRLIDYHEKYE